jgi:hypothetical protein
MASLDNYTGGTLTPTGQKFGNRQFDHASQGLRATLKDLGKINGGKANKEQVVLSQNCSQGFFSACLRPRH